MVKKKRVKRGYPVALLIGIENQQVTIWKIFSQIAKFHKVFPFEGFKKDNKVKSALAGFYKTFFEISGERSRKHISNVEKGSSAKRLNMFRRTIKVAS